MLSQFSPRRTRVAFGKPTTPGSDISCASVQAYYTGQGEDLAPGVIADIIAHLQKCKDCQQALENVDTP